MIREMNEDLESQTVYIDGVDFDEAQLEKLCEAFDSIADFEIAPAYSLSKSPEQFYEERQSLLDEQELDNQNSRDNVMVMLLLNQQTD